MYYLLNSKNKKKTLISNQIKHKYEVKLTNKKIILLYVHISYNNETTKTKKQGNIFISLFQKWKEIWYKNIQNKK